MTERDTYEIIVDIDAWPSSRAALADVVAAVLGVPPHRIHPVLDLRDEPIAQYSHQEEADRVAEELATRGLDVSVRRRLRRRKSLQELTGRASKIDAYEERPAAPVNPAPVVIAAPKSPVAPPSNTMRPGWLALDDSGPAMPIHAGTAAGMPAWTSPSEQSTAPPRATENAEIDQGALNALMAIEATADTVEPGSQGGIWSDILGAALADRLVDDGSLASPSGVARAVSVAPRRLTPDRAAPPEASSERAASPKTSFDRAASPEAAASAGELLAPSAHTLVSPVGSATLHPAHSRAEAVHASALAEAAASEQEAPVDADGGSAWAIAGVAMPSEVVSAPGGVLRPLASMDVRRPSLEKKPPSTGTLLMQSAGAFAGFEEAAMATASEPLAPADQLTVGDKFVRLRQPSADQLADGPEPRIALLWGLAAPGAGFAYLGEPNRGFRYALGSVLIFPWIKGALDASQLATDVKEGRTLLRRKPDPLARLLYVCCFWAVVLLVGFGISVLLTGSVSSPLDPATQTAADAETTLGSAISSPPVESDSAEVELAVEPVPDPDQLERQLSALVREARLACEEERYAECERLAGEALDIDGRNRQALILQVEAVSHSSRTRPNPSETDNDREPDSPAP